MLRGRRVAVGGLLCGAWLAAASLAGCATGTEEKGPSQNWTINGGPKLRSAEGKVRVRIDDEDMHIVELAFAHLAPARQAFAGTAIYVIWLVPRGGPPRGVGIIDVNDALEARLTIKTPYENFDVIVTAERRGKPLRPSENRAFSAAIRSSV